MESLTGKLVDRYQILELLGKGGMAMVYKAYDPRLEREVAIKIIRLEAFPPEDLHDIRKRFEREAKALAQLSHPNIIKVMDYGEHEKSPFLVMEYLRGGTLKQRIGEFLSWQQAMRLLLPVVRGLEYAHRRGIVHRDIKPANILLTENGEPILSDFGIVKVLQGEKSTTLTGSGAAIGTPEYMAPEQWTGETSSKSDMYSVGVVLYEMITGQRPYEADTPGGLFLKQVTEPLPRPGELVPNLPEAVERFLLRTLSKEPSERYNDLGAFVKKIESLLAEHSFQMRSEELEAGKPVKGPKEKAGREKAEYAAARKAAREASWLNFTQKVKTFLKLRKKTLPITAIISLVIVVILIVLMQIINPPLFFSGSSGGKANIYSYAGKNITQITQATLGSENWSSSSGLGWNIYFTSNRSGKAEIYGFNRNTGDLWQATDTPGTAESWSPAIGVDGNLYFTSNRTGKAEIYNFNTRTGKLWQITDTPGMAESWSPAISIDGKLYFTSNRSGKAEIYYFDTNKGELWQITTTPGTAESWSPAMGFSGSLYFTSDRTGKAEIYKFNTHTGQLKQITTTPGRGESWSPVVVGKNIYFTSDKSGQSRVYRINHLDAAITDFESWTQKIDDRIPGY